MSWYLAPSLAKLREQIDEMYPGRSKASDGAVGDTAHSARKSDHNPDYSSGGVVRAIDITVSKDIDILALMADLKKDDRVEYFIYDHLIYGQEKFAARKYTGSNPHTKHIHISIRHTKAAESGRAWKLTGSKAAPKRPAPSKTKPAPAKGDPDIAAVQRALKAMGLDIGPAGADGIDGPYYKRAVKHFQAQHGLVQDEVWGPSTQARYEHNINLQKALNEMKSTTPRLVVDGYIGLPSNHRINSVLARNAWSRADLVANLKKVGAWPT